MDGLPHPCEFPVVQHLRVIPVRAAQVKIPVGAQGVYLVFKVIVGIVSGVEENLEIVVVINHGVVFRKRSPYVRLLQQGGEIHALVVVGHLRPCPEMRGGAFLALDIREVAGPRHRVPFLGGQFPVDGDRGGGFITDIRGRIERGLRRVSNLRPVRRVVARASEQQECRQGHCR